MKKKIDIRIWIGIIFILLGSLFIFENLGYYEINYSISIFSWEIIAILIGLLILANSGNNILGAVFLFVGLLGIFPEFWPLVFVAAGLYFIFKPKRKKEKNIDFSIDDQYSETINDVAVFGGGHKSYFFKKFAGGKITAIFGGSEIDLRGCKLTDTEVTLDVIAIFGGASFMVPSEWNVVVDVVPIFGGFSDSRKKRPDVVVDESKTLIVKGVFILGGGEIKD